MPTNVKNNIIANFVGRAWGLISVYLFVPLYIKFLGVEAYGLVGFYFILAALLVFADMGFSATLKRELARLYVRAEATEDMKDTVRTFESIYVFISFILVIIIWVLAPFIINKWLRIEAIQQKEIIRAVRLMGITVALQLPSGLYIGGLQGLQKQILTNGIQILWGIVRGVGTALVLWIVSPTISAFMYCQLVTNGIYLCVSRWSLLKAISKNIQKPRFKWRIIANTWRYSVSLIGMTVISTILIQSDKIIVSKTLPLKTLGFYTLASTLASAPIMLASSVVIAMFPLITGIIEKNEIENLKITYHRSCQMVAGVVIPIGLTLIFFSKEFIYAWTGSIIMSEGAGTIASLLICGQLMQAIGLVPYNVALAHGKIKTYLYIGLFSILFGIPVMLLLISKYGAVGAGISWFLISIIGFIAGAILFFRYYMKDEGPRWWWKDVVLPILITLPWILFSRILIPNTDSRIMTFCFIGFIWIIASLLLLMIFPEMRKLVIQIVARILRVQYGR